MTVSIRLTAAQIKGTKDYLREVDGIEKPNNEDVKNEWAYRFSSVMELPQESITDYIKVYEKEAK